MFSILLLCGPALPNTAHTTALPNKCNKSSEFTFANDLQIY